MFDTYVHFTSSTMDDAISILVDMSQYDLNGLCEGYELRRHKYENRANAGCGEAKRDWIRHIGPVSQFCGYNLINGNFTSVAFPLCKPERVHTVAYILEYAFMYDDIVEKQPFSVCSRYSVTT